MARTIIIILQITLLISGCATLKLRDSNKDFNRERWYATSLKELNSRVYARGSTVYYEIELDSTTLYVKSKNNGNLYLVDNAPSKKEFVGMSRIIILKESEFDETMVEINNGEIPDAIYVTIPKDKENLTTRRDYKLFYSKKGDIYERGPAINKLNDSVVHDIISTVRNAGYLFTVPYDVATAPLLIGAILVSVGADN